MTEKPVGDYIGDYIKVRDLKKELADKHKAEMKPYNDALQQLEHLFHAKMEETGLENLKTDGGTAYKAVMTTVSVADWDPFLEYVKANEAWYMLDKRANKTAVSEVLEDTGELPPGLNLQRSIKVNVRRD